MLNTITVQGRLTKEPELRKTQNQTSVTSFSIACERDIKGQDGKYATDFIDVVAWKGTADLVAKYFAKGNMIVVKGRLQFREWEDKQGNKRRNAEVLAESVYFCDSKKSEASKPADEWEEIPEGEGTLPF